MPARVDVRLDGYGISRNAYRELRYFCLQYAEKKATAAIMRELTVKQPDGMPRSGVTTDPTARAAERAAKLSADCDQIEHAAEDASGDLASYMLLHVTEGVPYRALNIPCSEATFYRARRRFFFCLALARGMV